MTRFAPSDCPVCGHRLALTRLGCADCGTELSGHFDACGFCSLADTDREMLEVFLRSRGNMKELERHLEVSYPTARARFDTLLDRLGMGTLPDDAPGLESRPGEGSPGRLRILRALSEGEIDVDEAIAHLDG